MKIDSLPRFYYKSSMPNYSQLDCRNQFMRDYGSVLCGPVAVSNILIYLAKKNFQMLLPPIGNQTELQAYFKLVEKLAKYMETRKSTGFDEVIEGIKKYIRERGYRVKVSQDGSWERSNCYKINDPTQIMKSVIEPSNAILLISWSRVSPNTLKYWRTGGHFVTLAGFSRDEVNELIIHDPSSYVSRTPSYCELEEIKKGLFCRWHDDRNYNARGFYELDGIAINTKKGANKAVVNGIIAFEVFGK